VTRVALIDYGAGNLASVRKGLAAAGAEVFVPSTPAAVREAAAIVVPGVGHFAATSALDTNWRAAIADAVSRNIPLLGICLGFQWLLQGSDEAPLVAGLALIDEVCFRLRASAPLKVPHVGWNTLTIRKPGVLLDGLDDQTQVYFTHSYAVPLNAECSATAEHGDTFAAAVERGNVFGVQFHPEKSGTAGLRILRNVIALARRA
jgi:glutamine amidotransferase